MLTNENSGIYYGADKRGFTALLGTNLNITHIISMVHHIEVSYYYLFYLGIKKSAFVYVESEP